MSDLRFPSPIPVRAQKFFEDYAEHHKTLGNRICHEIGIPLIMISLFGLLSRWSYADFASGWLRVDGGTLLLGFSLIWYLFLDWKLALSFGLAAYGTYLLGRSMPNSALWVLFVLGWITQFLGHFVFEKKQPKFFTNLVHIWVGPFWLFAQFVGYSFETPSKT